MIFVNTHTTVCLEPLRSFFDPPSTSDGKPYGPARYKEIVMERYLISKYSNTSYLDCGEMTPLERGYLVDLVKEEIDKKKQMQEEMQQKIKSRKGV